VTQRFISAIRAYSAEAKRIERGAAGALAHCERLVLAMRSAARAMIFLLKVLPMLPSRPIDWITSRPIIERATYPSRIGPVEGDLYRPVGASPVAGIVVCLGVVPFGVNHPQVARLGDALARSGFAALLYWSPAMRDRRLEPGDAENLALAYRWLVEQPNIDVSRSGLLGTCVGGSFALMAASDALIRERVAFVAAFAPYSSMWTFARDIASSTREGDHARQRWEVDPLTREVFVRSVTALLEPAERELVRTAVDSPSHELKSGDLSADGKAVYELLSARDLNDAMHALDTLPNAMRERLTALSPIPRVREIRAPLIVFGHDRDDAVVPVSESRQLKHELLARPGVHYTEFALFQHATPRRLPLLRLARELARFYRYVYPLFRAATA
jgi:hypothetical protein